MATESPNGPLGQLAAGPVFVVGWVRSGTTWVYDALTSHPEVGGVLESWMFTRQYGVRGPLERLHWEPDEVGTTQGLGRIATRGEVYGQVRELTDGWLARGLSPDHRYLVEKSPSHVFAMPTIAELYPGARFVHVIRDGRDVVVSARAAADSWASGWKASFAASLRSSAQRWSEAALAGLGNCELLGGRCLTVRYEELRERPHEGFEAIFDHCRVPASGRDLDGMVERNAFRAGPGGESAFRRRGEPGEWRRALGPRERLEVTRAARPGLEAAGYGTGRLFGLLA